MRKQEYLTPSNLKFVLREQTGADDDKLNAAQSETVLVNTYVANVIVEGPDGKPMDVEAVKKLRLGDKYFLMLASRILSLGETLYFEYQWGPEREHISYSEDLTRYLWDFTKPFPKPGDPEYFDQAIKPYPPEEFIEGKVGDYQFRMDYLDGHGETYLMKLDANNRSVNKELVARNLRIFTDGDWALVKNFASFSARDMVVLRNTAVAKDPVIEGLTTITDPVTGAVERIPLLAIKDFFYPVKI